MHKAPITISVIAVWNIYDCTRLNSSVLALPPEGAKVKGGKKNPTLTAQFSAFQIPSLTVLVRIYVVMYSPDLHGHTCKHI